MVSEAHPLHRGQFRGWEAAMYVGVLHTITNKAVWAEKLTEFEQSAPPDGYANPISYIGANTDYAFCLWDVPSVEALQPMLDGLTEGAATNMYFPVDPNAFGTAGIPSQRIDLDTKTPSMS
jgi:hypothetical protein